MSSPSIQTLRAKNATAAFPRQFAVVAGGTSGIGLGIARRLAAAQFDVTIVGRNAERAQAIVAELSAAHPAGRFAFVACDATQLASVAAAAAELAARGGGRIDRLVVSQGMATLQGRTPTREGLDAKLALHYYGRMLFVRQLLPALAKADSPRVLSVLSAGVHSAYAQFREDPELVDNYSIKNAADSAGFYTDLMLDHYALENKKIAFVHAAPGFVNTNWGTEMPWAVRMLLKPLKAAFGKSPEDCAEAMCDVLLAPDTEVESKKGRVILVDENGGEALANKHATPEAREFIQKHTFSVFARILGAQK